MELRDDHLPAHRPEYRTDRVFALMILGLGAWSAISLALLALNTIGLLPAP